MNLLTVTKAQAGGAVRRQRDDWCLLVWCSTVLGHSAKERVGLQSQHVDLLRPPLKGLRVWFTEALIGLEAILRHRAGGVIEH